MNLNTLLEAHTKRSTPPALQDNLGDGYLLEKNRLYRNIRYQALDVGFEISPDYNNPYTVLPLAQLEELLEKKKIIYFDNVSIITDLAKKNTAIVWEDLSEGLKKNYIFHESCHAVARSVSTQLQTFPTEDKIIQFFLEESFANTCELLALVDCDVTIHKIFYKQNSYTSLFEERTHLKNTIQLVGEEPLFKFLLLCYLHSHFLFERLDEKSFNSILALADLKDLTPQALKSLKYLAKIPFTLDLEFRTVTATLFLKLHKISVTLEKFDFLAKLEKNVKFSKWQDEICRKCY